MEKLIAGFEFIFSSYKRAAAIFFIAPLTLAIPVTLSLLGEQRDIRQRAAQVCANVAADIILVIDKSGSMRQNDAIKKASEAAKNFVNLISGDTNNRIGLVSFSTPSKTQLNSPLTNNFQDVNSKIDNLPADGETCTQCGIKKANEEISANKSVNVKNVVIILTDGRANRTIDSDVREDFILASKAALDEIKNGFSQNNTVFFTIGLGKDIQTDFLEEIANLTGGKYFAAPSADDLKSIYNQISQIVGKGSITGFVYNDTNGNGTYDQDEQTQSGWDTELKTESNQVLIFTTDSSGGFSFTGVCDGNYTLSLKQRAGWTITGPQGGKYDITIINGDSQTEKNFGEKDIITVTPTATPSATTLLNLSLSLTGIGATTSAGINNNPARAQRDIQASLTDSQNANVASFDADVNFAALEGIYKGTLNLGVNFASGPYLVKTRMNNTLFKLVPGIQNITSGTTPQAPVAALVSGDVNQDNEINLTDYTLMISCLQNPSCNTEFNPGDFTSSIADFSMDRKLFDFNDDDKIDEIDLNILYFGFAHRFGD